MTLAFTVDPVGIGTPGLLANTSVELDATSLMASYLPDWILAEIIDSGTSWLGWGTRSTRGRRFVNVTQPESSGYPAV